MTCRTWGVLLLCLGAAGCGRTAPPATTASHDGGLHFEVLDGDTVDLSQGAPLLTGFAPFRDAKGVIHARGRTRLPDGTRLQLTLTRPGERAVVARTQVAVESGAFETPGLSGQQRDLPEGVYRFELVAYFDTAWQPPDVMNATDNGRSLRGPEIVRGKNGLAAFIHTEDKRL